MKRATAPTPPAGTPHWFRRRTPRPGQPGPHRFPLAGLPGPSQQAPRNPGGSPATENPPVLDNGVGTTDKAHVPREHGPYPSYRYLSSRLKSPRRATANQWGFGTRRSDSEVPRMNAATEHRIISS